MSIAVETTLPAEPSGARTRPWVRLTWTGWLGAAIVAFWLLMALFGSWLAPFDQADMVADAGHLPMDRQFWLGSDYLGRDTLSRIMWGAATTIGIAVAATLLAYCAGVTLGIAAAVKGGWTDTTLSRANDVVLALPDLMLAL
ncbi:MAG: ABC transporter permease, partial [Burkholderiaceae bacterium]